MKNRIYPNWMHPLKLFLTTILTMSIVSSASCEVWAESKNQRIVETIKTLQQSDQRWIQIDLTKQRLIAWEGGNPVYAVMISSGKKSTPTQTGIFEIQSKHRFARMHGEDYDVPQVPYVMYYEGGYAIHGAYWHRKFGTPVSHGCVNLAPDHAKWLFQWASLGTPVIVGK